MAGLDFGQVPPGEIRGTKFHDRDGDGRQDPGEEGLAGWTIYLDLNNNGVLDGNEPTELTGANGTYVFEQRPTGPYVVREVIAAGWSQTSPSGAPAGDGSLAFVQQLFDGLGGLDQVLVSPDGAFVYTVGLDDTAISVFRRAPAAPSTPLQLVQVLKQGSPTDPLRMFELRTMAFSADGKNLYAASARRAGAPGCFPAQSIHGRTDVRWGTARRNRRRRRTESRGRDRRQSRRPASLHRVE